MNTLNSRQSQAKPVPISRNFSKANKKRITDFIKNIQLSDLESFPPEIVAFALYQLDSEKEN